MLEFKLAQGNRLRNAVGPLQHIRGEATVFCNSETLYLQASDIDRTIVALLRFCSGFFDRYVVNRKAIAGVGVLALGSILETTDDEDSIAVLADCRSNIIDFTFEDVAIVHVTASRVRFYAVGQEIVLTKEHGECIIGGVKEEDEEITLLGSLHHKINPILEASELCGTVWFLQSARRTNSPLPPPTMINCPIGLMANLNFYFVKE